jgi:hypothetical protein
VGAPFDPIRTPPHVGAALAATPTDAYPAPHAFGGRASPSVPVRPERSAEGAKSKGRPWRDKTVADLSQHAKYVRLEFARRQSAQ